MFFRNNQGTHNIGKWFVVLMVLWGYNVDAEETYVVRKVNWGMTPEQVRESETWKSYVGEMTKEGRISRMNYHGSLLVELPRFGGEFRACVSSL